MFVRKIDGYYVMRLEKGEEIISSISQAFDHKRLNGAFFFGIGVGKDVVLGYFDAHKKSYIKKVFRGEYEFTSLYGNVSLYNKEIIVHCHATITNNDFNAFGGHLFHGTVPATCEIVLLPFTESLRRRKDRATGLKLLNV